MELIDGLSQIQLHVKMVISKAGHIGVLVMQKIVSNRLNLLRLEGLPSILYQSNLVHHNHLMDIRLGQQF
jgi:hypothetical protein